jgi:site-specific DNA recombinase
MLFSNNKKINARIYARVSTELQRERASIDTQLERMRAYCTLKGFNIAKEYKDIAVSGKTEDRDDFQLMMSECKSGEAIICYDLTRFSRRTKGGITLLEDLETKGVRLCSLDIDADFGTPTGRILFTVLMAFGQYERELTSQKVSDTMKRLSQAEKLRSRAPFGWKFVGKDKDMVEDKEQQEVIEIIKRMRKKDYSFNDITRYLNEKGYNKCINNNKKKPVEGIKFYAQKVSTIYKGVKDKRIKTIHLNDPNVNKK